jgi:hypothetical protein
MAILDLLWGIINGVAILYFFYLLIGLIFRGRKIIQNHPRILSFPILILGILGILSLESKKDIPVKIIESSYSMESIAVPYSAINELHLLIYRNKTTGEINPVISESTLSGFVLGRSWGHRSVDFKEGKWDLAGSMTYSFMGAEIFSTDQNLDR